MAYEKLNLSNGTVLKAEHLAHIEEGLENIELTPGPQGETGADGKTPVKGEDYFTEADKEEWLGEIDAVRYTAQTLTDEQKKQARKNIDCGSVGSHENCKASGSLSHAEGANTVASGRYSHAEGDGTTASGTSSHAEGSHTVASSSTAHAEGTNAVASEFGSHAEGIYTHAASIAQHVQGRANIPDAEMKYLHIVGNGFNNGVKSEPSNAHTLDWGGVPWFAGDRVMLGGTGMDDENAVTLMPPLVVKIGEETPAGSGAYPADKTAVEIYEAYTLGRTVYAVDTWGQIYFLVTADIANAYFDRAMSGNWNGVIFNYMFIHVTSDGTATMEAFSGYCLPVPTAEDNGKTLKVVDGKWALV